MSGDWNDPWQKNYGVPGVVYVLRNPFFRDGFYKIGCTRTSGWVRAKELDDAAKGAIPKGYECVYERRSVDCGRAEQRTFEKLHEHRRGQHFMDGERFAGQEFFEIPLERAIRAIEEACAEIQSEYEVEQMRLKVEREERRRREAAERERMAEEQAIAVQQRSVAAADEEEPQSSYVYSWNKSKPGPSTGAVVAWICAVVFVGVFLLNSGKPKQPPRIAQATHQLPPLTGSVAQRYDGPPTQANGVAGEQMFVAPQMPGVASSTVPFPPAGSALYFAGKPEGVAQASSIRLYAPATAQGRYAVLVVRMPQNQVYAQAYMEPNDLVEVAVPAGRFRLGYSKGYDWFGTQLMFGPGRAVKAYGNEFEVAQGGQVVRVELPLD